MFPLRDENPAELTPYVTVILIAANIGIWVYYQGAGLNERLLLESVCSLGMIPADVSGASSGLEGVAPAAAPCRLGGTGWPGLFSSMFLHGSWLHLIGNMWFLWLFGNNVEDSMGHLRFVVFYLLTGLAGGGAHVWSTPDSVIPTVGASGAISGVMGAYLVLYPRVRIHTLFIIIFFIKIIPISAWLVLLYWFAIQLLSGTTAAGAGAGVAFWAHIGGFIAGVLMIKLFENRTLVDAKRRKIKLSPWEIEGRGWR